MTDTVPYIEDECTTIAPAHSLKDQYDVEFRGPFEAQVTLLTEFGAAQAEFDELKKDTTGRTGNQEYKYATFANMKTAVVPHLAKHGVGFTQSFSSNRRAAEDGYMLLTSILAGHGAMMIVRQWWDAKTGSPNSHEGEVRNVKDLGGLMTYLRRYAAQAILAIEGDRDEDQNPEPAAHRRQTPPSSQGRPQRPRQAEPRPQQPRQPKPMQHELEPEPQPPQKEKPGGETVPVTPEQGARLKELFAARYSGPEYSELSEAERSKLVQRDVWKWTEKVPKALNSYDADIVIRKLEALQERGEDTTDENPNTKAQA